MTDHNDQALEAGTEDIDIFSDLETPAAEESTDQPIEETPSTEEPTEPSTEGEEPQPDTEEPAESTEPKPLTQPAFDDETIAKLGQTIAQSVQPKAQPEPPRKLTEAEFRSQYGFPVITKEVYEKVFGVPPAKDEQVQAVQELFDSGWAATIKANADIAQYKANQTSQQQEIRQQEEKNESWFFENHPDMKNVPRELIVAVRKQINNEWNAGTLKLPGANARQQWEAGAKIVAERTRSLLREAKVPTTQQPQNQNSAKAKPVTTSQRGGGQSGPVKKKSANESQDDEVNRIFGPL